MFQHGNDGNAARQSSVACLLARAGLGGVPRTAIAGSAALVMLALGFVGWRLGGAAASGEFTYESHGEAGHDSGAIADVPEGGSSQEPPSTLWVHVAGAVRAPGLYELAADSRVGDAVAIAGGTLEHAALDAVNLARLVEDGEQVYVPSVADLDAGGGSLALGPRAGSGALQGPGTAVGIDINRSGASELEALPGVGPATAAKIVADREANGLFASPEDIMRVPGIGEKKFEAMRDMILVR